MKSLKIWAFALLLSTPVFVIFANAPTPKKVANNDRVMAVTDAKR